MVTGVQTCALPIFAEGVVRIDELFAQKSVPEPSQPQKPQSYAVRFDNVHFSYLSHAGEGGGSTTEALSGVSFEAKANTLTALVGPSGGGKSTIASLLSRFWDVNLGAIRIGGVDIRDMDVHDAVIVKHDHLLQIVALAQFVVVAVMGGGDLEGAGAEFPLRIAVPDAVDRKSVV